VWCLGGIETCSLVARGQSLVTAPESQASCYSLLCPRCGAGKLRFDSVLMRQGICLRKLEGSDLATAPTDLALTDFGF
jgi:uncharacterized protein (DUF983 family)